MKQLNFLFAGLLFGMVLLSAQPAADLLPGFNWTLFWSGSWEEEKTLHNRGEIKIDFISPGIVLRGAVLDRRPMNPELAREAGELGAMWGNPERRITNFNAGVYHKQTGSRLLFGVLDEWGLPARIRNPWIRSPPYAENRQPIIADLKTAASSTKEDEIYLYLSSPFLDLSPKVRARAFASAQTEIEETRPAVSGGLDFAFSKQTALSIEGFHTWGTLPPTKSSTWFSERPPLPERDFRHSSAGFIFSNPLFLISSDFAWSQAFAWGEDIYANFGICLTPLLPFGRRARPLAFSFAADGAGEKFVYRDGGSYGAGFRTAGKIEWKGSRNALFRADTVLRGPGLGEPFNRSSSGVYYRLSSRNASSYPFRLSRVSLSADRNAVNPDKIADGLSGYMGFSIFVPPMAKNGNFGLNFSGSLKGVTSFDGIPSPYPRLEGLWDYDIAAAACEFTWSPMNLQLSSKAEYSIYSDEKKDNQLEVSFYASALFKNGRLSLKAASVDFPDDWTWTVSWRLEKR